MKSLRSEPINAGGTMDPVQWKAAKDIVDSNRLQNWIEIFPDQAAVMMKSLVAELRYRLGEK
jgi:hypothetical protein